MKSLILIALLLIAVGEAGEAVGQPLPPPAKLTMSYRGIACGLMLLGAEQSDDTLQSLERIRLQLAKHGNEGEAARVSEDIKTTKGLAFAWRDKHNRLCR